MCAARLHLFSWRWSFFTIVCWGQASSQTAKPGLLNNQDSLPKMFSTVFPMKNGTTFACVMAYSSPPLNTYAFLLPATANNAMQCCIFLPFYMQTLWRFINIRGAYYFPWIFLLYYWLVKCIEIHNFQSFSLGKNLHGLQVKFEHIHSWPFLITSSQFFQLLFVFNRKSLLPFDKKKYHHHDVIFLAVANMGTSWPQQQQPPHCF